MAPEPRLVPCLVRLRAEFNVCGPGRDKRSDGWIGDTAHAATKSAHNPNAAGWVRAIDVDKTGPWLPPFGFNSAIEMLRVRHRTGLDARLQNIIWAGRITSRSWGWREWRDYDGPNSHHEHAHLEARNDGVRWDDTSSWHLIPEEEPLATQFNTDDKTELVKAAATQTELTPWTTGGGLQSKVGNAVLNAGYPARPGDTRTPTWINLQTMQESIDALADKLTAVGANARRAEQLLEWVDADFPGVDPESDPIVKRLRWVLANPPA